MTFTPNEKTNDWALSLGKFLHQDGSKGKEFSQWDSYIRKPLILD